MNFWFSSDLHFGHFNIIKYTNRPFKSLEDMNTTLIENWNSRVKEDDSVFDLGDFNFRNSPGGKFGEGTPHKPKYFEEQLNGKIIHILGNHNRNNGCKTPIERIILRYGGYRICLVHDPKYADPNVPLNFVGHVHNLWKIKRLNEKSIMVNVGVDCWGFKPINFEEISKEISRFKKSEKGEPK